MWVRTAGELRIIFRTVCHFAALGGRTAALVVANELMSCYLAINNTRLCKPIIDWADKVTKLTQADFESGEFSQVSRSFASTLSHCARSRCGEEVCVVSPFAERASCVVWQADVVTYHFYRARLRLLETDYDGADRYLTYAFHHCDSRAIRNERTILSFLIPVKLNLGKLPRVRAEGRGGKGARAGSLL